MKQLLVAVMIAVAVGTLLPGCAGQAVEGICAFQPLGQNEAGVNFLRYHCEPAK